MSGQTTKVKWCTCTAYLLVKAAPSLSHSGHVAKLATSIPTCEDVNKVKANLVIIVSRVLTLHITALTPLSKAIPKHVSTQVRCQKSQKWWYWMS